MRLLAILAAVSSGLSSNVEKDLRAGVHIVLDDTSSKNLGFEGKLGIVFWMRVYFELIRSTI
jgi:chromosome condensin MukBEF MukE localization factor